MSGVKIVLAGAGGYLAHSVIPFLLMPDLSLIYAFSSKGKGLPCVGSDDRIKCILLQMYEYYQAGEMIDSGCDVAINFSWIGARGSFQDDMTIQQANENNSLALLKSVIRHGCHKFIQIGSMSEYGETADIITEVTACHPVTAYAKSKLSCAKKMNEICDASGVEFIELRIGSMYGYYMDDNNLIGYLCRMLSQNRPIRLKTSCKQDWEYTHVDDLSEILSRIVFSKVPEGVYNISNGDTRSLKEFIQVLEERYGINDFVEFGNVDQGIGCQNIRCDNSKIKNIIGKDQWIRFEDGIDSVIRALG